MTRHVVRFIASVALLFGSLHAAAQTEPVGGWFSPRNGTDRGSYVCAAAWSPCEVQGIGQTPAGNNQGMISSVINDQLADPIWRNGDYFTVCNSDGSGCTTFTYNGMGNWFASGNPTSPPGGYHSDTARPRRIRSADSFSPSCGMSGSVRGHYEWYDYYSNGNYIGSGDLSWVVDEVSVVHQCV